MKRYISNLLPKLIVCISGLSIFLAYPQTLNHNNLKANTMEQKNEHNHTHTERHYNRLIYDKSPYLLQHAENPVDWYPWGPEAFERAKKENKPIFLSIGYSTCHWCHVMAHESFENPEVARLMNEVFVSIKVDREERPDIDNIYMTVCQMMTGSGGWPLTIIMTPDKKPFFAATYIPIEGRFGRIGMLELIPRIKELWTTNNAELLNSADHITASLQQQFLDNPGREELDESTLKAAYEQLARRFDDENGGFSMAPKFPTPQNLLFLLRYWNRTGNEKALYMVEKTLQAMRNGGIYDQIGFGFHRYSTDSRWIMPHFEKMLYDQAMLAIAYTEAYQATGKEMYRKTVQEIFTYVLRDMASHGGGFYSAEDADSEGEEGKFYLWREKEVREILKKEEANLFINAFNIETMTNPSEGPIEDGTARILHIKKPIAEIASQMNMSEQAAQKLLETAMAKLFEARSKRVRPHKDDKILTDWNGLMIAALAKGARIFDNQEYNQKYVEAASRSVNFILANMRVKEGELLHRYRDGQVAVQGNVDDYAFLIWGLLELYETTFDVYYLQIALDLNKYLLEHFWDAKDGGFYFTADDGEPLLIRQKEIYDGALPSGNSVAMLNLLRLGRITANHDLEKYAKRIGSAFSQGIKRSPSAYAQLMVALDFGIGPSYEVVIVGKDKAEDTIRMLKTIREYFIPNKIVIFRSNEDKKPDIINLAAFTRYQIGINGKATAYVCRNYSCNMPTTDVNKMLELLNVKRVQKGLN